MCSRKLRRGQAFDFQLQAPTSDSAFHAAEKQNAEPRADGACCDEDGNDSLGSTRVPSSKSVKTVVSSITEEALVDAHRWRSCVCPKCLVEMSMRWTCPSSRAYVEGVCCDRCSAQIVMTVERMNKLRQHFFHCDVCWFDLCHKCACAEMQHSWHLDGD